MRLTGEDGGVSTHLPYGLGFRQLLLNALPRAPAIYVVIVNDIGTRKSQSDWLF